MGPSAEFKHGLVMAHISLTRHEPGFADLVQVHDQGGSGLPCATISVTWLAAKVGTISSYQYGNIRARTSRRDSLCGTGRARRVPRPPAGGGQPIRPRP